MRYATKLGTMLLVGLLAACTGACDGDTPTAPEPDPPAPETITKETRIPAGTAGSFTLVPQSNCTVDRVTLTRTELTIIQTCTVR